MEAKFYRTVLVWFSLAATMMQVAEAFIPRISRSLGTSSINYNIGVKRNGRSLPLNTNPRKIDVGEESIARFGKVRLT